MKTRIFGRSGRAVGEVGLGTWQIGANWGDVTEETRMATLRAAYEAGRRCSTRRTSTAWAARDVHRQIPEGDEGEGLRRDEARRFSPPGWPENFSRAGVRSTRRRRLQRLGVEALDLTQLHCIPFRRAEKGRGVRAPAGVETRRQDPHFGVSVESMEEAAFCVQQEASRRSRSSSIFSARNRSPRSSPRRKANVALLVRLPLASGLLGGKMTKATTFPASDHRNFNRDGQQFNVGETFAGLPFAKGVELADALKPLVPAGMRWAISRCAGAWISTR